MSKFLKERDFGEIVSETFNFFIKEFVPLAKVLLVFIGPFILINAYLMFKYQSIMELGVVNFINTQNLEAFPVQYLYLFIVGMFQNIMLVTVVSAFVKLRIQYGNSNFELSKIWNVTSSSLLSVTLGQILLFIAVFLGVLLIVLTGNVAISFLMIFIWGGYVFTSLYLLSFVIVFENKSIKESISRTLFIAKKNRWFIFGAIIVFGLIIGLSNLLISFIIEKLVLMISAGKFANVLIVILSSLISVALSAIIAILPAFLYASFLSKKENPELLEKINQINSGYADNSDDNE